MLCSWAQILHLMFSYNGFTCLISPHIFKQFIKWLQELVLFAITGPSLKDQYPIRDYYVVMGSIPKIGIFYMMLCYRILALIRSVFIGPNKFPWVLLQIVYGSYTNCTYGFYCLARLRMIVARVLIGHEYLTSVICHLWSTNESKGAVHWRWSNQRLLILIFYLGRYC